MGTIYRCSGCGADLNLSEGHLFPEDAQFDAGNRGTLSFSWVDEARLRFSKEDRIMPFFETRNSWGFLRRRTCLICDACELLLGHVYLDGPPTTTAANGSGQGAAPPRAARYRFKIKSLNISSS